MRLEILVKVLLPMTMVIVGHLSRDLIVTPDITREVLGGGTAYAMIAPSLGMPSAIVSKIGKDFEQDYYEILRRSGLDVSGVHISGAKSTRFVNKYGSEGHRTQSIESLSVQITPQDIPEEYHDAEIVHFSPLTAHEIDIECFKLARAFAKITSLDVQGFTRVINTSGEIELVEWGEKQSILEHIDVVKFHDSELNQTIQEGTEKSKITQILDLGPSIVLVTRDTRGSTIYTKNEEIEIPLIPSSTSTDATGCGDVYTIGFLIEYTRSLDLEEAGVFAAACASFNVENIGPYNIPSLSDVRERVQMYFKK